MTMNLLRQHKKWIGVVAVGIIALGLVAAYFIADQSRRDTAVKESSLKAEAAAAALVKSTIDLYYAYEGEYPMNIARLFSEMKESPNRYKEAQHTKDAYFFLKAFNYSVRGDGKAYRITYRDFTGNTVTVDGEYLKDYQ